MSRADGSETVRAQIDARAAEHGERLFLIAPNDDDNDDGDDDNDGDGDGDGETITFAQLKASADDIGARLDRLRAKPRAKVAFLLDNGAWIVRLFLSIMASGRVAVPLNAVAGPTQLRHVLDHSDAELAFVSTRHRAKLDELLARIDRDIAVIEVCERRGPRWPDSIESITSIDSSVPPPSSADAALLLYTSGSTGLPKGALLSHRAVVCGGRNVAGGHALTASDRALCVLPVYHINGAMVTVAAPLCSGGSVVMPRRFSANAFWRLAATYRCTWSSVVPTIIKYLLDRAEREPFRFGEDARLRHFRFGRSASAPLPTVVLRQWEAVFRVPMIETLGLTETAGTVATNPMPPATRKVGSVGRAHGDAIRIIALSANDDGDGDGNNDDGDDDDSNNDDDDSNNDDDDGNNGDDDGNNGDGGADCAVDVVGEIVVRGDNLLDEYYKDAAATRAAFARGWFRTGDLGRLDRDGYLFVTGRLKELIIRGGENIAPREIDDALYRHEAVLEAAAVGVKHPDYGQEVVACVALREGFDCDEPTLRSFCLDAVGAAKAPKRIYFMQSLPKGPSGKILRLELPRLIESLRERD
ncbi:MAG: AMP-binding protein [bacterium]